MATDQTELAMLIDIRMSKGKYDACLSLITLCLSLISRGHACVVCVRTRRTVALHMHALNAVSGNT